MIMAGLLANLTERMAPVDKRRLGARVAVVAVCGLVLASGAYAGTRAVALRDAVLPGVEVAGVEVGTLARNRARAKIESGLADRLGQTVVVEIGDASFTAEAGEIFTLDASASERAAYEAKRDGIVGHVLAVASPVAFRHDVEPVLLVRPEGRAELRRRVLALTVRPVNARVRMNGVTPVVVPSRPGTIVPQERLESAIRDAVLAGRRSVELTPSAVEPSISDTEASRAADVAALAVSAPVELYFRGDRVGTLSPRELARLLRFAPRRDGYALSLAQAPLARRLGRLVGDATHRPEDARFAVDGKRVRVVPARAGVRVAPARTARGVLYAAVRSTIRTAAIVLARYPAHFTTREARRLGIREELSSFTTDMGESSSNRIWNVQLLGRYLDGTIVKAGETFSYNKVMGPRTVERGFREGQMIFGGVLVPSIGGGVCQTATTIFNAAFEAGLPIKERRNHSFYISHYPMGRDATVAWGGQDLVFKNDLDHAILIKAHGTTSTFTVAFYGTKQGRRVVASTSEPTNYTQPELQYAVDPSAPAGSLRTTGAGGPGFDVNVHRKVYERGKLIREDDFFSRYVPENPTAIYGPGRTPPGPYFTLPASA